MRKNYSIGLDIGTNSVGYSVIFDDNYKVPVKNAKVLGNASKKSIRKNLMGSVLFDSGETAMARRMQRTNGRRIERRRNRIRYLQEIFAPYIMEVDENFFARLQDSFLWEEDKPHSKYPFFGNVEQEVAFHDDYKTIYHLRKKLADGKEKADLRLVYLALAHIVKFRGHFLIEGNIDIENNDIQQLFDEFLAFYSAYFEDSSVLEKKMEVREILTEKLSKLAKKDKIVQTYAIDKKSPINKFLELIVGKKSNFQIIFELEEEAALQFSKESYEDDLTTLLEQVGDEVADVFIAAKKVYDSVVLANILSIKDKHTKAPLSAAMIERYKNHRKELAELKQFFKATLEREIYKEFFNDPKKDGYAGYIDGSTTQEAFYTKLKKLFETTGTPELFKEKIEQEDFLRKQRTFDNGSIPHQIHQKEFEAIIERQGVFYPFLLENKDKLIKIFEFRIPYYVGPLAKNQQSPFAWATYHTDEPVRPWNFKEIVDTKISAEEFIHRMTNYDIYLPDQKVLPKHSYLYELFTVYNELTKIKFVDDQNYKSYFNAKVKKDIIDNVFKKERKVTYEKLMNYLRVAYADFRIESIVGLNKDTNAFNASLGTYHDLLKLKVDKEFLDNESNLPIIEDIILTLTIFEERKMIRERLSQYASYFDEKVMKRLERRHYTGWGRLSKKIIAGIRDNGKTILDYLKDDPAGNRNFMQLIRDDYLTFKKQIAEAQVVGEVDSLVEQVQALPGSPAIKKGVLQAMKIVDELVKIMGYKPTNIVIEMARENQTTKKGQKQSQPRYTKLSKSLNILSSNILKENSITKEDLMKEKIYLYCLQNGIDMYTGKPLDINYLSNYDVDHIIPRSFLPDDSIDNKVLVSSKLNRGKADNVPSVEVVNRMEAYWRVLLNAKLISESKYNRLTKAKSPEGGLSEKDKEGFIHRQLVETRQITKHIARMLDERWNQNVDESGKKIYEVKIVTLKSSLVSNFRKMFDIPKIRELNRYHHAHDAYLNAVVGNLLIKKYPRLAPEFIYGQHLHLSRKSNEEEKATKKVILYSNVLNFLNDEEEQRDFEGNVIWNKNQHIGMIKKVIFNNQVTVVKKTEIQSGSFTKETVKKKGTSDKLIPRKNGWEIKKYGGFQGENDAYCILFKGEDSKKKKGVKNNLLGISIMNQKRFEDNPNVFLEELGYTNIQKDSIIILPKYTLFELEDGKRRRLASHQELQKANELTLSDTFTLLLYHALHRDDEENKEHREYLDQHRSNFIDLFDVIIKKSEQWIVKPKVVERLKKVMENKFDNASIDEISASFLSLLTFMRAGASSGFKFFEEQITMDSLRYQSVTECLTSSIIYQSVTGFYETRIDLNLE